MGEKISLQASEILANVEINASEVFIDENSIISAQSKGFDSDFSEKINKDLFEPDFLSKGGMRASEKASENRGGGKIIIQSQEIKIDGILEVNGEKGKRVGFAGENNINGADAGALFIRTQELLGKGIIRANGGDDGPKAGNGGRIAIYFQENNFEGEIQAFGGKGNLDREEENGGPGTIFLSNQKEGINQLIIDNGGHQGVLDLSQDKLEIEETQLYIKGGSIVVFPASVKNGALILEEGGLRLLGNSEIYVSEIFKLVRSFIESPQKKFLNINAQEVNIKESEIIANLKVKAENFELDQNSSIIANALGYDADEGPGKGAGGSGAGYGGRGGNFMAFEGGNVYGDLRDISDFGSGGGTSTYPDTGQQEIGGKGGGLIVLETEQECIINGVISANGEEGKAGAGGYRYPSGAGSGGGIMIDTNIFKGDGEILANGGKSNGGGSGGGGRIAIFYNNWQFNGQIKADSGQCSNELNCAENGTIELVQK